MDTTIWLSQCPVVHSRRDWLHACKGAEPVAFCPCQHINPHHIWVGVRLQFVATCQRCAQSDTGHVPTLGRLGKINEAVQPLGAFANILTGTPWVGIRRPLDGSTVPVPATTGRSWTKKNNPCFLQFLLMRQQFVFWKYPKRMDIPSTSFSTPGDCLPYLCATTFAQITVSTTVGTTDKEIGGVLGVFPRLLPFWAVNNPSVYRSHIVNGLKW